MILGISVLLALAFISKIGADMIRWPTVKRFASWLGRRPGRKISRGLQKALTAMAHKNARAFYDMLRYGVAFSFAPMEEAETRNMEKKEVRLRKRVAGMDDNWFGG